MEFKMTIDLSQAKVFLWPVLLVLAVIKKLQEIERPTAAKVYEAMEWFIGVIGYILFLVTLIWWGAFWFFMNIWITVAIIWYLEKKRRGCEY